MIKTPFLIVGVTRVDLKHCGKIPDTREELNGSVVERVRIESVMSLVGMGSRSCDLGARLRMHSLTVDCDTNSHEEK